MRNIKARCITFCLAVSLFTAGHVWSNTIYVEPLGNDTRSGLNAWTNAVATIGVGLSKASDGDIILVSNGTYNITAAISITKGITLTNFSGNPEDTTINAQGLDRVLTVNHTNALVSGFSLINGRAAGFAGVYLQNGIIENCIISSNHSTGNSGGGGGYVTAGRCHGR